MLHVELLGHRAGGRGGTLLRFLLNDAHGPGDVVEHARRRRDRIPSMHGRVIVCSERRRGARGRHAGCAARSHVDGEQSIPLSATFVPTGPNADNQRILSSRHRRRGMSHRTTHRAPAQGEHVEQSAAKQGHDMPSFSSEYALPPSTPFQMLGCICHYLAHSAVSNPPF